MTRTRAEGFSLLEVIVAMAILAVSLTALFSSEAGAVKMAYRARRIGLATQLARCKMIEIEEQVALEGLPAVSDVGNDECCEDAEIEGFSCDWEIERIVLPDSMFAPEEEGEEGLAGALTGGQAPTKSGPGANIDKLAAVNNLIGSDPTSMLSGGGDQAALGSLAGMAMSYVFPVLKPSFEEQIRRATVTVRWKEGERPMSFDVTQYLVAEQPTNLDPNAAGLPGTTPGVPGAPGLPAPVLPGVGSGTNNPGTN